MSTGTAATTANSMRSNRNYHAGLAAEGRIAQDYERRGFSVSARRWRKTGGEIDIIVRNGAGLVFVEVKKSKTHAAAAERVSRRQMQRLVDAGARYLAEIGASMDTDVRFDVALVDGCGTFEIVENAFGA